MKSYDISLILRFSLQIALLIGAVVIAATGHDGWGWLVFLLWVTLV